MFHKMKNKIKNWFYKVMGFSLLVSISRDLDELKSFLFANIKKPFDSDVAFMRHLLGSIDLSEIENSEMSESERKAYCSQISAVFPLIEKDIKKLLYEQLMFSSEEAETWDKVIFGRGTFNGMDILLEHWRKAHLEHLEKGKPKENFDVNNPIGEI